MVYKRFYSVLRQSANRILAGHSCVLCGLPSTDSGICPICKHAVQQNDHACYQCGDGITSSISQQKCGACLKKPKNYRRLIAACHYDFPINRVISRFKFNRQLHLGSSLIELLIDAIKSGYKNQSLPEAIIPIPLHHKRLAERGFNQSALIAKQINRSLDIPITQQAITRIKNTPHQIGLKAVERRKNLTNAFAIQSELPKHIALVDDVVTTGTTITEATKVCLKHGAEQVDIWCLAKT
ncbi:MAG: ComF family protein [Gammaproteobacteria bacterium]|nr:ComF family protein [Gammaproteobacteria bacterium]